jgi:glutamate racemase
MADARSIGIFDSGIGGLPIAKQVRAVMPNENLIYLADTLHAPYGEKTEAYILERSLKITDYLLQREVKAIVVACNTATLVSIKTLRERYPIPFIGVEPGLRPAALNTKTGVIGVLATAKTLTSQSFHDLAQRVAMCATVEIQPCPDLVLLVEALKLSYEEASATVQAYVQPLLDKGADTIILGCTHFTHLKTVIQKVVGETVNVISTEEAVAREVNRRLQQENLLSAQQTPGSTLLLTNSERNRFEQQVDTLWGEAAIDTF